jgi:hypothetical protein
MRGKINAAGNARDNDDARAAEAARQPIGEGKPRRRGIAGADDRDGRLGQRLPLPAHGDQRRRGVDGAQRGGIVRLPDRDEAHADCGRSCHLLFGFRARGYLDCAPGHIASDQFGKRLKRRAGAAEAVQQSAKRPRSDVFAADQLQPVEPLFVGEARAGGHCSASVSASAPSRYLPRLIPRPPVPRGAPLTRAVRRDRFAPRPIPLRHRPPN